MKIENIQSLNTLESLQEMVADLQQKLAEKEAKIQTLSHQIHLFRTARFGRKSEKFVNDAQLSLGVFDEASLPEDANKDNTTAPDEISVSYTRKKHKTGRKPLPKSLPYVEKVYDLSSEEKECSCGCTLTHIGDETSEQLDILPQVTFRVVHIKKKYACKACEDTIKSAKSPKQPFPKSIATAGLVAAVIDAKFNRHLPLYRQEDMFKSSGTDITRASLGNWIIKAASLLEPLVNLMIKKIQQGDIAFADETALQVLKEKNRPPTTKSYMWLFAGGEKDKRCFVYQYHQTRAESAVHDFFADFKGYLHADCYRAYVNLDNKRITHVACLAHARRYFADIIKSNKGKPGIAVDAIKKFESLYTIEKNLKQQNADVDKIFNVRQEKSLPILNDFKAWLLKQQAKVPPKSPIAKALFYSIAHWESLTQYVNDGRLEIDNNRAERAIKPFVIGRKNWLFHDSPKGAHAGAALFSLVQTCKEHNVNVFAYFKFAMENILHCKNTCQLEKLLPFNCDIEKLNNSVLIPDDLVYVNK